MLLVWKIALLKLSVLQTNMVIFSAGHGLFFFALDFECLMKDHFSLR